VGAELLVDAAIQVARSLQVSEALIGLTVVAIGTSAPELVTTLVSTVRGDRDIAIGNLLGSSVYNIALVLGITILVAPPRSSSHHRSSRPTCSCWRWWQRSPSRCWCPASA
jgi:cation:H+ antiporter